jgi:hypothetical protein
LAELKGIILDFNANPGPETKRMLWDLYSRSIDVKGFIDASVDAFNGKVAILRASTPLMIFYRTSSFGQASGR